MRKTVLFRLATSNVKLFLETIWSLYIYKDLRLKTCDLRSSESRDHYHEDGNLVPSPRCGFSFEAAFQLEGLKLTISVYIRNATFR